MAFVSWLCRFISAALKVGGGRFPLPPYGQGWLVLLWALQFGFLLILEVEDTKFGLKKKVSEPFKPETLLTYQQYRFYSAALVLRLLNNLMFDLSLAMFTLCLSSLLLCSRQKTNHIWCRRETEFLDSCCWFVPTIFCLYRFESVYMDEKIRVAKDIRGNYLVVCRDPSSF